VIRLTFRTSAAADLRRVARETRAAWGEAQAALYSAKLRDDIKSLHEFPLRFPEYLPRPGLRRINSGRHAVFYLVSDDRIEIVAVLHVASGFERWM
jgi:plasmid stabilization system protein ParE